VIVTARSPWSARRACVAAVLGATFAAARAFAAEPAAAAGPAASPAKLAPAAATAPNKPSPAAPSGKPGAATKPAPEPPKPPVPNAALAQLKTLAGSWTCTGRTFGPGPEHATSATLAFAWQLDGFWLEVRYDEQKTAANPVPFRSIFQWGFDDVQQGLAAAMVDNLGGLLTATTAGWQGDKLVLEGTAHRYARQFQARDTFVRRGADQLAHTLEADVNGSWIKLHEDTCSRAPAK
jgi:hypothetical protein